MARLIYRKALKWLWWEILESCWRENWKWRNSSLVNGSFFKNVTVVFLTHCHAGAFISFLSNTLVAMHPVLLWSFSIMYLCVLISCIYNYIHFFISLLYLAHWKLPPSACIHKQTASPPLEKEVHLKSPQYRSIHPVSNLEQQQQKLLIPIHYWTST